jgi:hypothetical protein
MNLSIFKHKKVIILHGSGEKVSGEVRGFGGLFNPGLFIQAQTLIFVPYPTIGLIIQQPTEAQAAAMKAQMIVPPTPEQKAKIIQTGR